MGYSCLIMLMIFSWCLWGLCQGQGDGGGGGYLEPPECIKPLIVCSLYINQPSPPPTCCRPLKKLIHHDLKCLCDVFSNPLIVMTMNVTQVDAVNFANACDANVTTPLCDIDYTGSSPNVSPLPPDSSPSSPPSNAKGDDAPNSAASLVSKFGGSSSIVVIFYFITSMF